MNRGKPFYIGLRNAILYSYRSTRCENAMDARH